MAIYHHPRNQPGNQPGTFAGLARCGGVAPALWLLFSLVTIMALLAGCGGGGAAGGKDAGATAGDAAATAATATAADGAMLVNRIVYQDNNGGLFTIAPDGSDARQLGNELPGLPRRIPVSLPGQPPQAGAYYFWPAWSPDGARIAVSLVRISQEAPGLSVLLLDAATGEAEAIYTNELNAAIADGSPHYLHWSPDGRRLAFISATPEGLTLFAWDGAAGGPAEALITGSPLYFGWSPDGASALTHAGDRLLSLPAHPSGGATPNLIAEDSTNFRAPSYSPDGASFVHYGRAAGGSGLVLDAAAGNAPARLLFESPHLLAFLWAPDGRRLAVGEYATPGSPLMDRIMLVSPEGGEPELLTDEQSVAFFWAPGGDRIAWVGVDAPSREMLWLTAEPGGDAAPQTLFKFRPSGETFALFSFCDQYAQSHSPWSPDGQSLVFAGSHGAGMGRANGSAPDADQIYVLDTATGESRAIAAGKLAFWSWN